MNSSRSTAVKVWLANMKARVLVFVAVFAMLALGMIGVLTPAAVSAASSCPSGGTPPPGSTVDGGLDVDGTCILVSVTVNGGITVEATGHLSFQDGTVNGGIVVLPCGELDVNATTLGAGVPTGTSATINGGIVLNGAAPLTICPVGSFADADIFTALIDGGILVTGNFPGSAPRICNNEIRGHATLNDVFAPFGFSLGDEASTGCPGNTIHGAVHVSNSSGTAIFRLEVEGNIVGGSVLLSGSTLELQGNTINGSLRCSNGTVLLPGEPGDPANTVHGANTC